MTGLPIGGDDGSAARAAAPEKISTNDVSAAKRYLAIELSLLQN
jgi:hypothetical protein